MEERAGLGEKNLSVHPGMLPYSQIPVIHSRSSSQPTFFSLDSLSLPWSENHKTHSHRRSNSVSDVTLPPLIPPPKTRLVKNEVHWGGGGGGDGDGDGDEIGDRKSEGEEVTDEFVSPVYYMRKRGALKQDDLDRSRDENEATHNSLTNSRRTAGDDIIAPSSVSMIHMPISLDFGNGEFNAAELNKIMAKDKLAEIALTDPKRVKRILANRQSAARSKERKVRYISELEHKVQTLQSEATTLSGQLTLLQKDSAGLNTQNNELKFRLHAMEQQAHLRDALNEALIAEVKRLKLATGELSAETHNSSFAKQLSNNSQMFQLQHQLPTELSTSKRQEQQQQQQTLLQSQEQKQHSNTSVIKDDSDS